MKHPVPDESMFQYLETRVGRIHLRQRLGIETDYEAKIFGQGRNFFHIENWLSIRSAIKNILKILMIYGRGKRNARTICLRHNDIYIESLPLAFDGFTLLHITDLHIDMNDDIPTALIEVVQNQNYDVCVLTGDFRANTFGPIDAALKGMKNVRPHLREPIYGVLGNHDSIRMVAGLEQMGIRMLLNEFITLERGNDSIFLAGIDDPHYYRADNMEKASDNIPPEAVSILLAHSPEVYQHAAHADFNVMLCGHTHGGQICLPGGIPILLNARCPRRFCAGPWEYHQLKGYTSTGSGSCIVDARINCPPEITLHHLHCSR